MNDKKKAHLLDRNKDVSLKNDVGSLGELFHALYHFKRPPLAPQPDVVLKALHKELVQMKIKMSQNKEEILDEFGDLNNLVLMPSFEDVDAKHNIGNSKKNMSKNAKENPRVRKHYFEYQLW